MAIKHTGQAYDQELGYTLKFVLVALSDDVNCDNEAHIFISRLSKKLGMNKPLLKDCLHQLCYRGNLEEIPSDTEIGFKWMLGENR